jgi:hypothetical protein
MLINQTPLEPKNAFCSFAGVSNPSNWPKALDSENDGISYASYANARNEIEK